MFVLDVRSCSVRASFVVRGVSYIFALFVLVTAGCDRGGLNLAPVEGVVTYNGAPLADAGVLFSPNLPEMGPPASGTTDAEGRFSLITVNSPGAAVGGHRVAISKEQMTAIPQRRGFPLYKTTRYIPEKFGNPDTSELTAEVKDEDNHFEFNLKAQK
jgi:hypothetical protein